MSWTSPQDIIDRWVGYNAPTNMDSIQAQIDDAESIILKEFPKIQDRINSGSLKIGVVRMVVSRMVIRVFRNPEGLSSMSQATGPFSQSKSYSSESDVWMTSDEYDMLSPIIGDKAFNIDTASRLGTGYFMSQNVIYYDDLEWF